jgi:segregation and condensation protein A
MGKVTDTLSTTLDEPVHLAAFEGPLDLLLYLVRRSEIDIYDIPIAEITRQYMDIIEKAREDQLEIAGDFFVLAATLMRIKSRLLLPSEIRPATEEEAQEDPRWELAKMLLEYNRFKEAAGALTQRIEAAMDLLPRRIEEPAQKTPAPGLMQPLDRFEIWNAFNAIMRRLADRMREYSIEPEKLNVSDCMAEIRERLKSGGTFVFTDLLPSDRPFSRLFVAVNILALLELARLGALHLVQNATFDDIVVSPASDTPPPPPPEEAVLAS